jgi:hypothetical protein
VDIKSPGQRWSWPTLSQEDELMEETFCAVNSSLESLKKLSKGLHREKRTIVHSLVEKYSDVNTAKKHLGLRKSCFVKSHV